MPDLVNDDWTRLSDEWRAEPMRVPLDIVRQRVRRQSHRMRLLLAFETLLSLVAVVALVLAARRAATWDAWLVIAGLAIFSARIWIFSVRNRRGVWRERGDTIAAFQALEAERLTRRIAAARFTWQYSVWALIPLAALGVWRASQGGIGSLPVIVVAAGCAYLGVCAAGARWMEGRLRAADRAASRRPPSED
jgi:hypothetical protein